VARKPIRVSQLNSYLAKLIAADGMLSDVSIVGEVSNFKLHGSGHVYFSLVDDTSRIDCFLSSGVFRGLDFAIADGSEIVAEGYVNIYEKGGRYSLTIRKLFESGQGSLFKDFEQLKKRLLEKGYFDDERKKAIPGFPDTIAVITSETGAAVNDIIKIISTRNSVVDVMIYPTLVQGEGSAEMIASRIRQVNAESPDTDVMIVGRGGGSSEDLAAFNEEIVADAIFESGIPVISAVGHETDFTISDFVADRRAETPTAAAMLACPDTEELREDVEALMSRLSNGMARITSRNELRLQANNMEALIGKLKYGYEERRTHVTAVRETIKDSIRMKFDKAAYRIHGQNEKLDALSPLRVLTRGYAIIENEKGRAIGGAGDLSAGDAVSLRFSDGRAGAVVKEVKMGGRNE